MSHIPRKVATFFTGVMPNPINSSIESLISSNHLNIQAIISVVLLILIAT